MGAGAGGSDMAWPGRGQTGCLKDQGWRVQKRKKGNGASGGRTHPGRGSAKMRASQGGNEDGAARKGGGAQGGRRARGRRAMGRRNMAPPGLGPMIQTGTRVGVIDTPDEVRSESPTVVMGAAVATPRADPSLLICAPPTFTDLRFLCLRRAIARFSLWHRLSIKHLLLQLRTCTTQRWHAPQAERAGDATGA